ncbi:homoserine O-succinyltransferase [Lysobacter firmicutimachus]|uniref:Homoserine O-succinyltransferase n=1 Tax=Lysobacter firmicutimachus TaxID=1792846 RepID=A0AAU8MU46_9GAMM
MSFAHSPVASFDASERFVSHEASALAPVAAVERLSARGAATRGEIAIELDLRHAGRRRVLLRYETQGEAGLPALFVAGGISAHRHLAPSREFAEAGWWHSQVGAGRALDPQRFHLVSFDWIGADGELDAPLDPADQADAIAALLDALRIPRLQAFIGYSYGAMVGLQFASRHPARLGELISISGTHRAHPYAAAWRALQRRAVALGALQCDESQGLALARELAVLSYRTPEEFAERFGPAQVRDGRVRVAAEDYLDHCGHKYVARTSTTAFLRLSESIDLQQVDPSTIRLPVTVVAVGEDRLIPLSESYDLIERLRGETRLRVLRSIYGHDACLKEETDIDTILREALADCSQVAA